MMARKRMQTAKFWGGREIDNRGTSVESLWRPKKDGKVKKWKILLLTLCSTAIVFAFVINNLAVVSIRRALTAMDGNELDPQTSSGDELDTTTNRQALHLRSTREETNPLSDMFALNSKSVDDNPGKLLPDIASSDTATTIFYNIYANRSDYGSVNKIIMEQISQIGESFDSLSEHAVMYYVNIGDPIEDAFIQGICDSFEHLACKRLAYYERGFEEKTLGHLWRHCNENPSDKRVIYVHNKGSYHNIVNRRVDQHVWRRAGTRAAVSDLCLHPPDDSCDFCGLLVTPLPWLHIPGNFWASKCSYINKLMHPDIYQKSTADYVSEIAEPLLRNRTMNMLFQSGQGRRRADTFFGDGRFTAENWIGSHPSAIPCDVAPVSYIQYWQEKDHPETTFNFSLAPRRELRYMMEMGSPQIPKYILKKPSVRIRDYHLLGGMITRWLRFYKQIPGPSSWVWSYYPDATTWQNAVAKYGDQAFNQVTATFPAIGMKNKQ